jgi:Leucine-rich repeat (LRR) protein
MCTESLDLSPIGSCTSLQILKLCLMKIDQLSFIRPELCVCLKTLEIDYMYTGGNQPICTLDIHPLSLCTNLEVLDISAIQFADTTPLASCVNLRKLNIMDNMSLVDISSLAYCTKLEELNFAPSERVEMQLCDMYALRSLHNLRVLNLSRIPSLEDISFMGCITTLTSVDLSSTSISSVAALNASKSITDLDVTDTRLASLEGFSGSSLKRLKVDFSCLSPVVVRELLNLEVLHISVTSPNSLVTLSGVDALPRLRYLNIFGDDCCIDLSPLARCSSLEALEMVMCTVESLRPLQRCARLWRLACSEIIVHDDDAFGVLSTMRLLEEVNVRDTSIDRVDMFAECKSLRNLNICDTRVRDIAPLAQCTALENLSLFGTRVRDLSPLRACRLIRHIDYRNTRVTEKHFRKFLKKADIDCDYMSYDYRCFWGDEVFMKT